MAGQTRDTRLYARAIRQGWPVKPERRASIIDHLQEVLRSRNASARETLSTCRAIIAAEAQNQSSDLALLKLDREAPSVNVRGQAPASPEPLIDKSTLAEALALMAEMGYVNLSEKGQDLVRRSRPPELYSAADANGAVMPHDAGKPSRQEK